jgi:hypothetical protein
MKALTPATARRSAAALRALNWLCVALIVHASLYPWIFRMPASFAAEWAAMMARAGWTSLGDVVGNIAMFVPLGALWAGAHDAGRGGARQRDWWLMALGSFALAFGLQVLQIYVPTRIAGVSDTFWNLLGQILGVALGIALRTPLRAWGAHVGAVPPAGLVLVVLWFALEWAPLLPRLGGGSRLQSTFGPLLHSAWHTRAALEAALALVVVAQLVRVWRMRALSLLGLVLLAAFGKLFIEGQTLTLPHAVGWLAGLALAMLLWRLDAQRGNRLVIGLALAGLALDGLHFFHGPPLDALGEGAFADHLFVLARALFWLGAIAVLTADAWRLFAPATAGSDTPRA